MPVLLNAVFHPVNSNTLTSGIFFLNCWDRSFCRIAR